MCSQLTKIIIHKDRPDSEFCFSYSPQLVIQEFLLAGRQDFSTCEAQHQAKYEVHSVAGDTVQLLIQGQSKNLYILARYLPAYNCLIHSPCRNPRMQKLMCRWMTTCPSAL